MSLAATGGAGMAGGGGLAMSAMAHGGPSAMATHQAHSQQHGHSSIPGGTHSALEHRMRPSVQIC
ncbi:hypothetical protein QTG54_005672 [Skeletonema marinoi]|uniref:Uncharacterized protein n=1 Tax=Skeletonema marinoi TaxID=267567 RepID=A0AAD9DFM8_9STRA|nr:hypothetical protein QTG54_005672 [Skeletonema marinoi]